MRDDVLARCPALECGLRLQRVDRRRDVGTRDAPRAPPGLSERREALRSFLWLHPLAQEPDGVGGERREEDFVERPQDVLDEVSGGHGIRCSTSSGPFGSGAWWS